MPRTPENTTTTRLAAAVVTAVWLLLGTLPATAATASDPEAVPAPDRPAIDGARMAERDASSAPGNGADTSMKAQAERTLSDLLGIPVRVGEFALSFGTVQIRNLTVGDPGEPRLPRVSVRHLSATCDMMSLLGGKLVLEDVTIATLTVRLTRDPTGALVLGRDPGPASFTAPAAPTGFPFRRIKASGFSVRLHDEGASRTVRLRVPTFDVARPADGDPVQITLIGAVDLPDRLAVPAGPSAMPPPAGGGGTTAGTTAGADANAHALPFRLDAQATAITPLLASVTANVGPVPFADLQTMVAVFIPDLPRHFDCQTGTGEAGMTFSSLPATTAGSASARLWCRLRQVGGMSRSSGLRLRDVSGEFAFAGFPVDGRLDGQLELRHLQGEIGTTRIPVALPNLQARLDRCGPETGTVTIADTELTVMGTPLRIGGELRPGGSPPLRLRVNATLDLAKLHRALPDAPGSFRRLTTLAGTASLSADVVGPVRDPRVQAALQVVGASFTVPGRKLAFEQLNARLTCDLETATIDRLTGRAVGGELSLQGSIRHLANPILDLNGRVTRAALADALATLRATFPTIPRELRLSGPADITLALAGPAGNPAIKGTVTTQAAEMALPMLKRPFTRLRGAVAFDRDSLRSEGLRATWGTSAVQISGRVDDLANFRTALTFMAEPMVLSDLSAVFFAPGGCALTGSGRAEGTIVGPPARLIIEGRGAASAGQLTAPLSTASRNAYAVPFRDLATRFRFADGTVSFTDARAAVFGGTLTGRGTVDPRQTPVAFDFAANGSALRTEAFLAENTSQKQVITGPIDVQLQAAGNVAGLTTWNGRGSITMKEGRYQAPPVVTPLLSAVNLGQFANGELTGVAGTFSLRNGVLTTQDLVAHSTIGKAFYRGEVGLDTRLNGKVNLVFSPTAVAQSAALREISLDGKTTEIPSNVRGTLLAPEFPGFSAGKLLELGLRRKGQKLLQDAILGGGRAGDGSAASGTKKVDPGKELLRGLEGIFRQKRPPTASAAAPVAPAPPAGTAPAPAAPSPPKKKNPLERELEKLLKF